MDYFIIATRKSGKTESEITHYRYNHNKGASGIVVSKPDLWAKVNLRTDDFYSFNTQLGTVVNCKWYHIGDNGEHFLKSDPNGTERDNLLKLPDC